MARTKKVATSTTTENLEQDTTSTTSTKEIRETVVSFTDGDDYCTIYTNQRWGRNLCKEMLEEHPDDCTLVHEWPEDGTIEIRCPAKVIRYIRYPNKRELTDEQRDV